MTAELTVIVDNLVVSLLEEFDCGESLDLKVLDLVGGGVHLSDHNGVRVLVMLTQLVPDGRQLLTVAWNRTKETSSYSVRLTFWFAVFFCKFCS